MYSAKPQVLELAALMAAHGVTDAVVCAGARNAPLSHTLAACPAIRCVPLVDERSAAFTAIGMSQATGRPVAVCCTSGSAVLDMAPAVAEAFYQQVPLLVISADRPRAWIGQMDAQTMEQPGALRTVVKHEVSLPEPHDEETLWHCNRLINEALMALTAGAPGPVHVNIPIGEPLYDFSAPALPEPRVIRRHAVRGFAMDEEIAAEWTASSRPMVVVGQLAPGHGLDAPLRALARAGCLVVIEQLSNLAGLRGHANVVDRAEALLAAPSLAGTGEEAARLAPDLVITLGGHVVSKRLKLFLRRVSPRGHWHVSPEGAAADLFQRLTRVVEAPALPVLEALAAAPRAGSDRGFLEAWGARCERARKRARAHAFAEFCDAQVMGRFLSRMPADASLQLGNSMPLRNAEFSDLPEGTRVFCNRGVNGIDGSLSVAAGYASLSGRLTFCALGDLSFFYDANALWRERVPDNLRVLLFNNGGGAIFHSRPGLVSPYRDRFIAGANARAANYLAMDAGMDYISVCDLAGLDIALDRFCRLPGDGGETGPMLLEVFTDIDADTRQSQALSADVAGD